MGANFDVEARKIANGGIVSSYACSDPTLNLEDGLYVHTESRLPVSSLEDLLINLVEWYMHFSRN